MSRNAMDQCIREVNEAEWQREMAKAERAQSRLQQNGYHAIIGEIALARQVSRELAKRVMVAQFKAECAGDPHLMALWAGVSDQTRDFPKGLASAFTDFLYAWKAENVE